MKALINLLLEILLTAVSFVVFPALFIAGIIYSLGKHIYHLDYSLNKQLQPIFRSISLSLDGLANAGAGELLNDTFKLKGKLKYGKWYQTISAVTGLAMLFINDTWLRRFLDKVLGKNHCVDAISEEDKYFYKINH